MLDVRDLLSIAQERQPEVVAFLQPPWRRLRMAPAVRQPLGDDIASRLRTTAEPSQGFPYNLYNSPYLVRR